MEHPPQRSAALTAPTATLRLRPVTAHDEPAVLAAHHQSTIEGHQFAIGLTPHTDFAAWAARQHLNARGFALAEGTVPSSFLLADLNNTLIGRVSIRHHLNTALRYDGGHIGCYVLPEHRRHGHATTMLRHALIIARAVGVHPTLLTCHDDNRASITIIEAAGGQLDTITNSPAGPIRRYWIT